MKIVKYIKNSLIDFPRHIACVAFTFGCNYKCWYCQNYGLLNEKTDLSDEFFEFLASRKGWIEGVVICGGEPTIHADLPDVIKKIKDMGFDIKLDTNGSNPLMIKSLIENKLIDYVAMDLKAPRSKFATMVGPNSNFDNIIESVNILKNSSIEFEFRTTVTPELDEADIIELAQLVGNGVNYYLQPYRKPTFLLNAPNPHPIEMLQKFEKVASKYANRIKLR